MNCKKCEQEIPFASIFCLHCGYKQSKVTTKSKPKVRGNGTGTVYKRGKVWQAQVVLEYKLDPTTGNKTAVRRSKSGFKTKKEALEYLSKLSAGSYNPNAKAATFKSIWDGYSTSTMLGLSTNKQRHYRLAFKRLKDICLFPVATLTIHDLQNLIDTETQTFYPAKDIRDLLSNLYKRAIAQQDVTTNLATFLVLPPLDEREVVPFDNNELVALWEDYGADNKITGYILLMIYSGMMPGELLKTEKNMIDWGQQSIIGSGLKTKKRKETPIVIADIILPVLKDLYDYSKTDMLLDVKQTAFYKEFQVTMSRCNIQDKVPYDCRHTTATALSLSGVAPKVIQEVMRHSNFDTTKRYIHTDVDTKPLLEAVNKITGRLKS